MTGRTMFVRLAFFLGYEDGSLCRVPSVSEEHSAFMFKGLEL